MPAFLVSGAPGASIDVRLKSSTYIEARAGLWVVCYPNDAADLAACLANVDRGDGFVVARIVSNEDWDTASKILPDVKGRIKAFLEDCRDR